jgi:hypothetical protein
VVGCSGQFARRVLHRLLIGCGLICTAEDKVASRYLIAVDAEGLTPAHILD